MERYAVTSLSLTGHYDQLIQRSVHLQPKLLTPEVNISDQNARKPFRRKVDLSNYRLYTTPLVTINELEEWVEKTIKTTPW